MADVLVMGGSLAGLLVAAAAAGAGARVLVLDRDDRAEEAAARAGVPQGPQPHVLLHRGLRVAEELVPGLRADLLAAGAVPVDTGLLPWHGEHGWLPELSSYQVLSVTRPLLEGVVRRRVRSLPGVELHWGTRIGGLERSAERWHVDLADGSRMTAPVVVDAMGRSSRLSRWLADWGLPVPEPLVVDARLGYSTRLIGGGPDPAMLPGVVLQATPDSPAGGIALPVEGRRWLVGAVGFGDRRPPRDPDGFSAFLAALPDTCLASLAARGTPIGGIAVHRQTANRRQRYSRMRGWPDGLFVTGDALCCFDPVYGQGITVCADQARHLRTVLSAGPSPGTARRVLRDFDRILDFPWAVAVGQDLQMPSSPGRQTWRQAAVNRWASAVSRRAVLGDRRAYHTLSRTYHLEGSPGALLHPALVASVVLGSVRTSERPPRPAVLDALNL